MQSVPETLKILIVGTPRTGNTWIKYCLSLIYDLPVVDFPPPEFWRPFDAHPYDQLGRRWIAHQHLPPYQAFVDWTRERNIVLATTVRHPGDTLVSLYYYVRNFAGKTYIDPQTVKLLLNKETRSSRIEVSDGFEVYVRTKFFKALNFSIAWLQRNLSYGIRYENLWYSPLETLQALTDEIRPVPEPVLKNAVAKSRIEQMRSNVGEDRDFFRGGGVGGWRSSLPRSVIELLDQSPPYPAQFRWLGYDLDPEIADCETQSIKSLNSKGQQAGFPTGLTAAPQMHSPRLPVMAQDYGKASPAAVHSIQDHHSRLNAPASDDPHAGRLPPLITNLGARLYRSRPDLQQTFPDLYGRDRVAFSHWFTEIADEGALANAFITPVYQSWVQNRAPTFSPIHLPAQPPGSLERTTMALKDVCE
jgi:Sulfotransferase domain